MTTRDVRNKFSIELNAKSDGAYDLFVNEESDEFISFAIRQFYARRLSGFTPDRTSFEQWQKRSDDLRCVYTKEEILPSSQGTKNNTRWYSYQIPLDYWHMLSEDIDVIESRVVNETQVDATIGTYDVFECTTDNLTARLNDSLGEHIYHKKRIRPLRLYVFKRQNNVTGDALYLDSVSKVYSNEIVEAENELDIDLGVDYNQPGMSSVLYMKGPDAIKLGKYTIEYIRKPDGFGLYSREYAANRESFDDTIPISQVPDYAWDEVFSIAIKHALENSSSYRLQTYNSERAEIQ